MKRIYLLATIALTGCATDEDPRASEPLPDKGDNLGYRGINQRGESQPCGYHVTGVSSGAGFPPYAYEYDGAYTYDSAGNVVSEHVTGEPGSDTTYEYDALGNTTRMTFSFVGGEPLIETLAYDSFGRILRTSQDYGGDGVEDSTLTYSYADGASRPTTLSQRILTDQLPNSKPYDTTYHYDELARRIASERDFGPDGTIDQTSMVVYDDVARTVFETRRDATGTVLWTMDSTYAPSSNNLAHELMTDFDPDFGAFFVDFTWEYDGPRLIKYTVHNMSGTPTAPPDSTTTTTYRYDNCN